MSIDANRSRVGETDNYTSSRTGDYPKPSRESTTAAEAVRYEGGQPKTLPESHGTTRLDPKRGLDKQSNQAESKRDANIGRSSQAIPGTGKIGAGSTMVGGENPSKGAPPSTDAIRHGKDQPNTLSGSHSSSRPTHRGQDLQSDLGPSTETAPPRRESKGDYSGQAPRHNYRNEGVQEQMGNSVLHGRGDTSDDRYVRRSSNGGVIGAPAFRTTSEEQRHDYVPQEPRHKSTGFASEGGNFDATKPGAGREAERTCSCLS